MAASLAVLQTSPTKTISGFQGVGTQWDALQRAKDTIITSTAAGRSTSTGLWPQADEKASQRLAIRAPHLGVPENESSENPDSRKTTNYQQMAWVTAMESKWGIRTRRQRPCPAELSWMATAPGPDGCEGHQEGHQPYVLYSWELAHLRTHTSLQDQRTKVSKASGTNFFWANYLQGVQDMQLQNTLC